MRKFIFIIIVIYGTDTLASNSISNSSFLYQSRRPREQNIEDRANSAKQGFFSLGSGDACISPDGTEQGVCLHRQQCSIQGGRVVGSCGVFSSCCALTACDIRTNAKNSVFTNPSYSTSQPYNGLECSYTVEINNENVCQMRIDLDSFSLAQPTIEPLPGSTSSGAYFCIDDIFQVTNLQSFSQIIPPLCGENSGQHLYVRVNASINSRTIRLSFKLADRNQNTALTQAVWRIRVTQLECYNTLGIFRDPGIFSIPGSERTVDGADKKKARSASTAARDQYLIAPDGCLQYYPDRAGTFESFNYNRGLGPYTGNLHYATCFRRAVDVCGIKFSTTKFELAFAAMANMKMDGDCVVNPFVSATVTSEDYLFIPQGESVDGLRGDKWCGDSAEGQVISSTPPGPLYIYFNTDNICEDTTIELGYRFNYNILNNC